MILAVTRVPSKTLGECELTFVGRESIDVELALAQHRKYCEALESAGATILCLDPEDTLPDATFVEDCAVVLDEVAVLMSMGSASRSPEVASIGRCLERFRETHRIVAPGRIEGGDVLQVGKRLYVGVSGRTNEEGIRQLSDVVGRYGYSVHAMPVGGCLHLKTAISRLNVDCFIVHRGWVDVSCIEGADFVEVPKEEPWGANVLVVCGKVIAPVSCPRTVEVLVGLGLDVDAVDVSEFQKAEAGVTCLSIVFRSG